MLCIIGAGFVVELWLIKEFIGILLAFVLLLLGSRESNADKSMGLFWLGRVLKLENVWLCFIWFTLASIKEAVKSLAIGLDVNVPDTLGFNCPDKWFCDAEATWLSRSIFCFSASDKEAFEVEAALDEVGPCLELSKLVAKAPIFNKKKFNLVCTVFYPTNKL